VNVLDGDAGMAMLRSLGARSVPIVARAGKFVYAQVIKDVVDFLGLNEATGPTLSPLELGARAENVLVTTLRLVRQMPDSELERQLPNRPRAWRMLMHHVFQIQNAFLDMEESGSLLTYENLVAEAPDDMRSGAAIVDFGEAVLARYQQWWGTACTQDFSRTVSTYFGDTSRHDMLERTVWHSAQHARQVASLLEQIGIAPDRPLTPADVRGLPLTDKIWD
jgi:hypothetical protein